MKGSGGEAICVDVEQRAVHATIAYPQQVAVRGPATEGRQSHKRIEAGAVVMDLPLDAADLPPYLLSQYLRAFPFQPQWGTVGMKPTTVPRAFAAVLLYPKYLM